MNKPEPRGTRTPQIPKNPPDPKAAPLWGWSLRSSVPYKLNESASCSVVALTSHAIPCLCLHFFLKEAEGTEAQGKQKAHRADLFAVSSTAQPYCMYTPRLKAGCNISWGSWEMTGSNGQHSTRCVWVGGKSTFVSRTLPTPLPRMHIYALQSIPP